MKSIIHTILFLALLATCGCIVQFIPETTESKEVLVVEGLITDQFATNKIKLSKSQPLGKKMVHKPFVGCDVSIIDSNGETYNLTESSPGTYITDSTEFRGEVGGIYYLVINTDLLTFKSIPMEMKPVPPIDSIYYTKEISNIPNASGIRYEYCNIFLNSNDPSDKCLYYRWDFIETWEFHLPYDVPNRICWISNRSDKILIKNTAVLDQARVTNFPINVFSNRTDRLQEEYSILINQYSLNENELSYWEKLRNVSENVGGLYDLTPMAIPSNVYCIENPDEPVLGYFSVSAVSKKRFFIKDRFLVTPGFYKYCPTDTIFGTGTIPNLNISVWIIESRMEDIPAYRILTRFKECADCTIRGTNIKPLYWDNP